MARMIIFKLVQGVLMADGTPFDAILVAKAFQELEDELTPLGYLGSDAVDAQTVLVKMERDFILPFMTRIAKIEFEVQAA